MGEIYRILFQNPIDTKTNSLILKIAPRNPSRREITQSRTLFLREISMYDEVNKEFNLISYFCKSTEIMIFSQGFIILQ